MLRLAIPDYRLPPEVVDREIEAIVESGVEIKTGVAVGKDITLDALRAQGYNAILIATGAHQGIRPDLPGVKGEGVLQALDFLKAVKQGKCSRLKGDVLVVGTTYAALDAARTAIRLGASKVGLVYPRNVDQLPFERDEVMAAQEEGVVMYGCHQPVEVVRDKGAVTGLKCRQLVAQPADKTGRSRTVAVAGEPVVLGAESVIFGQGQEADFSAFAGGPSPRKTRWAGLEVDPLTQETSSEGVFAAGDCASGGATVIEAVAMGQRAAAVIHRRLRGLPQVEPYKLVKPRGKIKLGAAGEGLENFKRPEEAQRPAGERAHDFKETDTTFSEMLAVYEARRCLRCGIPPQSAE
jgi:NADPH-dependent glutamate synthase beta subunit-like oxidoreductase